MNRQEAFDAELAQLEQQIAGEGRTPALEARLRTLYEGAALVIAFGPTVAVESDTIDKDRQYCNQLDLDFYSAMLDNAPVAKVFDEPRWGEVSITRQLVKIDGVDCPAFRVAWADRLAFIEAHQRGESAEQLRQMAGFLAELMGSTWYRWRVAAF